MLYFIFTFNIYIYTHIINKNDSFINTVYKFENDFFTYNFSIG